MLCTRRRALISLRAPLRDRRTPVEAEEEKEKEGEKRKRRWWTLKERKGTQARVTQTNKVNGYVAVYALV